MPDREIRLEALLDLGNNRHVLLNRPVLCHEVLAELLKLENQAVVVLHANRPVLQALLIVREQESRYTPTNTITNSTAKPATLFLERPFPNTRSHSIGV